MGRDTEFVADKPIHPPVTYSIQRRLQSRLLWLLLLLALLTLVPVHFAVRGFVDGIVENRLEHDAETIISALNRDAKGQWSLNETRIPAIYQRVSSGHYFRLASPVFSADSRSIWDRDFTVPRLKTGERLPEVMALGTDERLMTLSLGFEKGSEPFTVWVAEDLTEHYRDQTLLEFAIAFMLFVVIGVIIWLQRKMIAAGFAHLTPIQKALDRGDIIAGVSLPEQTPEEIVPLVNALRRVLERSAAQVVRSRTSMGNLAHELKRPIQKLHWLADDVQDKTLSVNIQDAATELEHLMNRELRRARISGNPTPGRLFNPSQDLSHLIALFNRIYSERIEIKTGLPDGDLPYDRDDLLELVGNIVDNACRYAKAQVHLHIDYDSHGNVWCIEIDDDGVGVKTEDLTRLRERCVRLDENDSQGGSGLGISISYAVVESYGGEMIFLASPLGGLRVTINLPV